MYSGIKCEDLHYNPSSIIREPLYSFPACIHKFQNGLDQILPPVKIWKNCINFIIDLHQHK